MFQFLFSRVLPEISLYAPAKHCQSAGLPPFCGRPHREKRAKELLSLIRNPSPISRGPFYPNYYVSSCGYITKIRILASIRAVEVCLKEYDMFHMVVIRRILKICLIFYKKFKTFSFLTSTKNGFLPIGIVSQSGRE